MKKVSEGEIAPKVRSTEKLNTLVQELVKPIPNQRIIELLMKQQGLEYQSDPILNMTSVLEILSEVQVNSTRPTAAHEPEGTL